MAKLSLDLFLDSLSIDSASDSTWRQVIGAGFDTLDKIRAMSREQLAAIGSEEKRTIGSRADKIYASLHSPRVEALLDLAPAWLDTTPPKVEVAQAGEVKIDVKGKNIVMTGTGPTDRGILKKILERNGAKVQSAVGSTTHILICESKDSTTTKAKAARKLGTEILGYSDVF